MKYLCLVYADETKLATLSPENCRPSFTSPGV